MQNVLDNVGQSLPSKLNWTDMEQNTTMYTFLWCNEVCDGTPNYAL